MIGRAMGAVLIGVDARLVEVEVDLGRGLPSIVAVGLPDSSVREGIDRIRAALRHGGFRLPRKRIVVNLAPAELPKSGTALDLPIALALLAADGQVRGEGLVSSVVAGELALDGGVRPIRGALAIAAAAKAEGLRRVLVPATEADEAGLVAGLEVIGVSSLHDLVAAAAGERGPGPRENPARILLESGDPDGSEPDLSEVRGQAGARRALEIAAAGGHNLLLIGPPGSGKTMLARRLPGILPPPTLDEALEITRVRSAAGLGSGRPVRRPFRAPHHGISSAALIGGGARVRPGEASMASGGVLYLDEIPEFRRDALESLRQPLEEGQVTVVRVRETAVLPARFALVASMNPCPCGWAGSPGGRCGCTPLEARRYREKLSGPLLDRFDLGAEVPALAPGAHFEGPPGEPSRAVRERVAAARGIQADRYGGCGPRCNAELGPRDLSRHAGLDPAARKLLVEAGTRFGLSARACDRIRRVARTIADLARSPGIGADHVAEGVQLRRVLESVAAGQG